MAKAYLALGSNLGDREANLHNAISLLDGSEISVVRASSIYETAPQYITDQPWFLNLVVEVDTKLGVECATNLHILYMEIVTVQESVVRQKHATHTTVKVT